MTDNDNDCIFCKYGPENPYHKDAVKIVNENYGVIDNIEIAMILHLHFSEKEIPTSKTKILEHIEGGHSIEPEILSKHKEEKDRIILKEIRLALEKKSDVYSEIFGEDKINMEKLEEYRKLQKYLKSLYKLRKFDEI